MDWAHGLVFSKQPFKTGMFGVVCDSSRTSSLSDYKFPTRLVDAFLLAQPTFAFIQNCELTQDVVCLSFLKNQISGVTTSIFRDGAYVGELWDNFGAEVVEMTLVLQ
jgi:hypothetical protein